MANRPRLPSTESASVLNVMVKEAKKELSRNAPLAKEEVWS